GSAGRCWVWSVRPGCPATRFSRGNPPGQLFGSDPSFFSFFIWSFFAFLAFLVFLPFFISSFFFSSFFISSFFISSFFFSCCFCLAYPVWLKAADEMSSK